MKVDATPSSGTGPGRESENRKKQNVFQQVETVVVDVVKMDIQHDVLVREDDEGVEENPPSQQHQKIEQAEMETAFALDQVGAPRHGGDQGHGVKEENNVKKKGIGERAMKDDF